MFERVGERYRFVIDEQSRDALRHFLHELSGIIQHAKDDPPTSLASHLRRLFPTAYHDDEQLNDEYRRLTQGDIADTHLATIREADELLANPADIDRAGLEHFIRALNSLRLVLGTVLDISESDEDPRRNADAQTRAQLELYDTLGWLVQSALEHLD